MDFVLNHTPGGTLKLDVEVIGRTNARPIPGWDSADVILELSTGEVYHAETDPVAGVATFDIPSWDTMRWPTAAGGVYVDLWFHHLPSEDDPREWVDHLAHGVIRLEGPK